MSDFEARIRASIDLGKAQSELNSFLNRKYKVDIDFNTDGLKSINTQLDKALKQTKIKPQIDSSGFDKASQKAQQLSKNIGNFQFKLDTKGVDAELSQIGSQIKKIETQISGAGNQKNLFSNIKSSYGDLTKMQETLAAKSKSGTLDSSDVKQYTAAFKTCQNEVKILKSELSGVASATSRIQLTSKLESWLKNNTKATKNARSEIQSYVDEIKSAGNSLDSGRFTEISNAFKTVDSNMKSTGNIGKSWSAEFKNAASHITQFVGIYGVLQKGVQTAGEMVRAVYDIDTAMTSLYKVTDETSARYEQFMSKSGESAKTLGRDMASYIEQTATWAKLGYNLNESSELAKTSSIYANVGEVDDKTAVSDIITLMKAFDIHEKDSVQIVDKLNILGNEFATSSAELGDGLSNAASALALGGMDINKSLALLTGGAEITQSAGELGNALKIGQMRVMGMKGALEELGEESQGLESVSKIQTHILNATKGQVNIMNSADPSKFRDYYDILQDVATVYDELDQTTQADLLETLFGKQRGNQGAALIQAFQSGQIQKAYESVLNSTGSAQAEQDRLMGSMDAKIQQFKASFQELSNTALDSSFLKGAIDAGSSLLDVLTNIMDVGGGIPTLLGTIAGIFATSKGLGKQNRSFNAPLFKIS